MVKAVLTENSVQWFVDKSSKEPFLEYDFKADEIKIYDEEAYYSEGLWRGFPPFYDIDYWIPKNCPDSVKLYIIEKIYNKRSTYNLMNYVTLPTRICKNRTVQTILDENSIKWFSTGYKTPFLGFDINLCKLEIYDKEIFILERFDALEYWGDVFPPPISCLREKSEFKKAWYPENCPNTLSTVIDFILENTYNDNKEFIKKLIKAYKMTGK